MIKIKNLFKPARFKFDPQKFDSIINAGVSVSGVIHYEGTMRVDGELSGQVNAQNIDESALVVHGRLQAVIGLEVNVLMVAPGGSIACGGTIKADTVILQKGASLECGVLEYRTLSIKDGAHLVGNLRLNTISSNKQTSQQKVPSNETT